MSRTANVTALICWIIPVWLPLPPAIGVMEQPPFHFFDGCPDGFGADSDRSQEPDSGDYDSALQAGLRDLSGLRLLLRFDIVDGILDSHDLLGVLIRDIEVECLLERHHQLDDIERVGAEVIDETRRGIDLRFVHAELLDDDLLDLLLNGHAPSRISCTNVLILPRRRAMPQLILRLLGLLSLHAQVCGAEKRAGR